jgi:hypothetical protein
MAKHSWTAEGRDWIKSTCSLYYIYQQHPRYTLYVIVNGGLNYHSDHSTLGEAIEAAEEDEEELYTW